MENKSVEPILNLTLEEGRFFKKVLAKSAISGLNMSTCTDDDVSKNKQINQEAIKALGVQNTVQLMLATQMIAVHELQQKLSAFSNSVSQVENQIPYMNTFVKLSNLFVQQATLMQKLQGSPKIQEQIMVGGVHVHNGGRAVVGNVEVKK